MVSWMARQPSHVAGLYRPVTPSPRSWHELKCDTHGPDCLTPNLVQNNMLLSNWAGLVWIDSDASWSTAISTDNTYQYNWPILHTELLRWVVWRGSHPEGRFYRVGFKRHKKKNVCDKNLNVTKTLTLKHEAHTGKCLKKDKHKSNIRQDVCNRKKMSPKQYTHTQMKCLRPAGQNKGKDEHWHLAL